MSTSATGCTKGGTMHTESTIMIVVSALMMIYLFYALLRPEKF
jgi:K+-transporting ATPase KdpF subunit